MFARQRHAARHVGYEPFEIIITQDITYILIDHISNIRVVSTRTDAHGLRRRVQPLSVLFDRPMGR